MVRLIVGSLMHVPVVVSPKSGSPACSPIPPAAEQPNRPRLRLVSRAGELSGKLFDKMTPGDLHAEIFERKNVAAAILAGSVIIGVSLILAAAMGN
jgi:hypothetical protein